jgi:hypothetical protein
MSSTTNGQTRAGLSDSWCFVMRRLPHVTALFWVLKIELARFRCQRYRPGVRGRLQSALRRRSTESRRSLRGRRSPTSRLWHRRTGEGNCRGLLIQGSNVRQKCWEHLAQGEEVPVSP